MADAARLWIETDHHPAFKVGGWAYVLHDGRGVAGAAGGERDTTAERSALTGLVQALTAAPAGKPLVVASASALVLAIPRRIAGFAEAPPALDLDLWAPLSTALDARAASFAIAASRPKTPTAFVAAWAELARDKAKSGGPFKSPIPKTNLAKAGV